MADLKRDGRWEGNFRLRDRRSGSALPVHLAVYAIHDAAHGGSCIAFVGRDITASRRSDLRLRFLLDAGAALSQSLDFHETFATLTKLVVDAYASYCVIDLFSPSENGRPSIERVAASHVDWKGTAFLEMFGSFVSVVESTTYPVAQAISDGVSSLMNDIDDTVIDRIATSNAQAVTLKALKLRSFVDRSAERRGRDRRRVKLRARARGGASIENSARIRRRGSLLPRGVGAVAPEQFLWNARLYARERRIADSLQSASLPKSAPALARYRDRCRLPSGEHRSDDRWRLVRRLRTRRRAHRDHDRRRGRARARGGHRDDEAAPVDASRGARESGSGHDAASRRTKRSHSTIPTATRRRSPACSTRRNARSRSRAPGHPGPLLRTGDGTVTEFQSGGVVTRFDERRTFYILRRSPFHRDRRSSCSRMDSSNNRAISRTATAG